MLSTITDWAPWIFLTCLTASLNLAVSIESLLRESRQLPFFYPQRHLGFWLWCLFQLLLPSITFWFAFSIEKKPPIDIALCIKAGLFGIAFIALVNASTQIGPVVFNIKAYYTALVGIAISMILAKEAGRTTTFWITLTNELNSGGVDLQVVLNYLNHYIESNAAFDKSLKDERRDKLTEEYKQLIKVAKRKKSPNEKTEAIINVVKQVVRRQHLPDTLKAFGCTQTYEHYCKKTP